MLVFSPRSALWVCVVVITPQELRLRVSTSPWVTRGTPELGANAGLGGLNRVKTPFVRAVRTDAFSSIRLIRGVTVRRAAVGQSREASGTPLGPCCGRGFSSHQPGAVPACCAWPELAFWEGACQIPRRVGSTDSGLWGTRRSQVPALLPTSFVQTAPFSLLSLSFLRCEAAKITVTSQVVVEVPKTGGHVTS